MKYRAGYIDFIKTFVENSNIMTKTFFMVVPMPRRYLGKSTNPNFTLHAGQVKKSRSDSYRDFEDTEVSSNRESVWSSRA